MLHVFRCQNSTASAGLRPSPAAPCRPHPVWLVIWLVLFLAIILSSLLAPTGQITTLIKLTSILLCLLYVVLTFPRNYFLIIAFFFTCLADLTIAYNNTSPYGIAIFALAHFFHQCHLRAQSPLRTRPQPENSAAKDSARPSGSRPAEHRPFLRRLLSTIFRPPYLSLAVLSLLLVCALPFTFLQHQIPAFFLICAVYGFLLLANLVLALRWRHRAPHRPQALLASLGFTLFFCCDLSTVFSYLALNQLLPNIVYAIANFTAWLFYYPSQIFIANTGNCGIIGSKQTVRAPQRKPAKDNKSNQISQI